MLSHPYYFYEQQLVEFLVQATGRLLITLGSRFYSIIMQIGVLAGYIKYQNTSMLANLTFPPSK